MAATLPDKVPLELDSRHCGPKDWFYEGTLIYNNGKKLPSGLPSIDDHNTYRKVGVLISNDGHLHIYIDGRHVQDVSAGLPVNSHIWGVVDVFGRCTKIKSERLSGEFGMYIHWQAKHA